MIDAETQRQAEDAEQLKHNQTWRDMLAGMVEDAMKEWAGELDADKREALWRDVQAIRNIEDEIEARLIRLSMQARKAERRK